jgi:hypothetical protein
LLVQSAVTALVGVALVLGSTAAAQPTNRRVFIEAIDTAGRPVTDLTVDDFQIFENGVERPVTRVTRGGSPMRIVVLVDSSTAVAAVLTDFRTALAAFLEPIAPEHEIAIISTGAQLRVRVAPTKDRQALREAAATFASDNGRNVFLDALLEADRRFLRGSTPLWPVLAIITTDTGALQAEHVEEFDPFVADLLSRGGSAHAVLLQSQRTGLITQLVTNLTGNTGGLLNTVLIANGLANHTRALAERIAADAKTMTSKYEVEYTSEQQSTTSARIEARIDGAEVRLILSVRR